VGRFLAQNLSNREAVHARHADVHQDDVRQQFARFAQGLFAIGGFADKFEAILARQA